MAEFVVDFGDPESVAHGIPRAKELIDRAEQRVAEAMEEVNQAFARGSDAEVEAQRLRAILLTLERLDAEPSLTPPDGIEEGSSKDQVLKVVTAINGPTDIAEVAEHIADFSRKTVSWALWKLADEGVIQRLGHGRYAPLGYVRGRPATNYTTLPPSFPTPSRAQLDQAADAAVAKARTR